MTWTKTISIQLLVISFQLLIIGFYLKDILQEIR